MDNISELKRQQAAYAAHEATQASLNALLQHFDQEAMGAEIVKGFANHGLTARIEDGGGLLYVRFPPSPRYVTVKAFNSLDFEPTGSVHRHLFDPKRPGQRVPVQEPLCLPVRIVVHDERDRECSLPWRGSSDNSRIAAAAVELFLGGSVTSELSHPDRRCFVATEIFGPETAEVVLLRQWRDQRLRSSFIGRVSVATYYAVGPLFAIAVRRVPGLRRIVRVGLRHVCRTLSVGITS